MNVDLLIKGGLVIDPVRSIFQNGDVAINRGKIVDPADVTKIDREIDAEGCLVIPGLIDFHAHVYSPGCEFSVKADSACLPMGVTTVVDAGSAGLSNYDNFVRTAVAFNQTRVLGLVHVSPAGMVTLRWHEEMNPKYYDAAALKEICSRYPGQIVGIKCRQSRNIVGDLGLEPLKATVNIAKELGLPVVVHVTDPPCTMDRLIDILRPGDVFCHCFEGTGNSILGSDGKVLPGVWEAKNRGVIFDSSNGKLNFSHKSRPARLFLKDYCLM